MSPRYESERPEISSQQAIQFGNFLQARRETLGKTLEQIQQECGVSLSILQGLERGRPKSPPRAKTLDQMAGAYQSDGAELRWRVGYITLEQYQRKMAKEGRRPVEPDEPEDADPFAIIPEAGFRGGEVRSDRSGGALTDPPPGARPYRAPPSSPSLPAPEPPVPPAADTDLVDELEEALTLMKLGVAKLERVLHRRKG